MNELISLSILCMTPGLGPIRAKRLLAHFGSAEAAIKASCSAIAEISGICQMTIEQWGWWKKEKKWQTDLELADKQHVRMIPFTSPEFPKPLLALNDHPLILYVKGTLMPHDAQSVAIVGTRGASIYGLEMAEKCAYQLSAANFTVVSGLARGIDTAAHFGALKTGRTLAFIGSGLACLYPKENEGLAEKITSSGAVISEYPMTTPPDKKNFPKRNRLVGGFTLGSLLIEAPKKSGAMITMEKALEYRKKLYAIPGRADLENFKGNHFLIKEGKAQLVENGEDIIQSLACLFSTVLPALKPKKTEVVMTNEEREFLQAIPPQELNIEELLRYTKLPIIKLNVLLMSLIIKKLVREYPGKMYKKVLE